MSEKQKIIVPDIDPKKYPHLPPSLVEAMDRDACGKFQLVIRDKIVGIEFERAIYDGGAFVRLVNAQHGSWGYPNFDVRVDEIIYCARASDGKVSP